MDNIFLPLRVDSAQYWFAIQPHLNSRFVYVRWHKECERDLVHTLVREDKRPAFVFISRYVEEFRACIDKLSRPLDAVVDCVSWIIFTLAVFDKTIRFFSGSSSSCSSLGKPTMPNELCKAIKGNKALIDNFLFLND